MSRRVPLHIGRKAGNGPVLAPGFAEDPYPDADGVHQQRPVIRNARSSPIHHLYERGRLGNREDGAARVLAAVAFQRTYERAEIGGSRGIDYEQAKVDTSPFFRGLPDRTVRALREVVAIRDALGRTYDVVEKVAGFGMGLRQYAAAQYGGHPAPGRARVLFGDMLILGLDDLIRYYGVARGPVYSPIRAA